MTRRARPRRRRTFAIAAAATPAVAQAVTAAATSPEIDLLERISQLSAPALLIAFIWLLATGRLVWRRELEREKAETAVWRDAALGRTREQERNVTVAEAAIAAAQRARGGGAAR